MGLRVGERLEYRFRLASINDVRSEDSDHASPRDCRKAMQPVCAGSKLQEAIGCLNIS
jgi:hypothetical protein